MIENEYEYGLLHIFLKFTGTALFSRGETKKDPKVPYEDMNETLIDTMKEMVDMDDGCVYDGAYDLV